MEEEKIAEFKLFFIKKPDKKEIKGDRNSLR